MAKTEERKYYTFGKAPIELIKQALERECPDGFYPMELVGEDSKVMIEIVNQGIDSHLEAITESEFKKGERRIGENGPVLTYFLGCKVSHKDMLVILRRLYEEGSESAWSLRSGILTTLDIEEV